MNETSKNFKIRLENGDFENYLNGYGIDIGGGSDGLKLPPNIKGNVKLWDFADGDAQYLHSIKDETFDFVYSSHCLEHMRNLKISFWNWLRVCKTGGYLYICVPHETYYEKGIWPSSNNKDHKHSFTVLQKSKMPKNVVLIDFLMQFDKWIEVIDIRENLMNYDFSLPKDIDQTAIIQKDVCAQIDMVIRKKRKLELSDKWRAYNYIHWIIDYFIVIFPIQMKLRIKKIVIKRENTSFL